MFYIGKTLQAIGISVIAVDFIRKFPNLMDTRLWISGILIFGIGWFVERFRK